jgi:hypothetical protein
MYVVAAAVTTLVVFGLVARPWWAEIRRAMRLVQGGARRPPASRAA